MNDILIDTARIGHPVVSHALGLNVNFLADHAAARARGQGYLSALRRMGVRALRYPGGEKSNEYFWSRPPWTASRPALSLTGREARLVKNSGLVTADGEFLVKPMDFDEFISLCRETGAEPVVCVGLGSAYVQERPGLLVGSSRARVLENAVEWVQYSNRVRGYGVKYWEIGNESYWRGSIAAMTSADYTRDLLELAHAMKAIDPTILVCANGHVAKDYISTAELADGPIWWQYLLERAAPVIDFLVVHPYPCFEWGGYDYYPRHMPVFTEAVDQALDALQAWARPEDARRIRVMATETNAFDWAASDWYQGSHAGWEWRNDLGHALVLFDILGQHLCHPGVAGVHVWNTRWFGSPSRLEDVLDDQNELLPTGQALGLWGRYLGTHLLLVPDQAAGPVYASYTPDTRGLTVFLVNKQDTPQVVSLELLRYPPRWRARSVTFAGRGPSDEHPTLRPGEMGESTGFPLRLELPPVSITVISFEALE